MTTADVQAIEKRLLQTIDMILVKKKRIALAKKGELNNAGRGKSFNGEGIWGLLKNVTTGSIGPTESILY